MRHETSQFLMVGRSAAPPSRLLRAVEPLPAASRLKPALLLSLQAFDTAVRLNSFKAAAEVLHLTPSAISHRIRNLEQALGHALFVRTHRAVEPTPAGRQLSAATGRAFADLMRATEPLAGTRASQRLRLNISTSFASAWLMPRVPAFMTAHPEVELVIESSSLRLDFENDAFHAAVRVGDGQWPGLVAHHLMDLYTTPVCTPAVFRKLRLQKPADVTRAPMIHVSTFPLAWPLWLRQAGAGAVKPSQTVWVDSFEASLQLAEQGAGIALGLGPLFAAREAAGNLRRPFPQSYPTGAYWLVHRTEEQANVALRVFRRWMLGELGKDD